MARLSGKYYCHSDQYGKILSPPLSVAALRDVSATLNMTIAAANAVVCS